VCALFILASPRCSLTIPDQGPAPSATTMRTTTARSAHATNPAPRHRPSRKRVRTWTQKHMGISFFFLSGNLIIVSCFALFYALPYIFVVSRPAAGSQAHGCGAQFGARVHGRGARSQRKDGENQGRVHLLRAHQTAPRQVSRMVTPIFIWA